MVIFMISSIFLGSLCVAQMSTLSQSAAGSSSSGRLSPGYSSPFSSSSAKGSSSVGPSGASSYAQASTKIKPPPQPYPLCLQNKPVDAVTSNSPFTYSLLEASFTNPDLKGFYNTSYDTSSFYDAFYDELKEMWTGRKSQLVAGGLALLLEYVFPEVSPLLNAVSIANAIGVFLAEETIVISEEKEDYIEPFLTAISKAVTESDGSPVSQARSVAKGLLKYLDDINELSYSNLGKFGSTLAGEYYLAITSTCKPTNFQDIPHV